jgi:hypothetical protein
MSIDLQAARHFIESGARVLERHQLTVLLDNGPVEPVLTALAAYQNDDGGFGHALEPDVRCPGSQPTAALAALDVLTDINATHTPMVTAVADWIATIAHPDGGIPTVLPSADGHPHAPWMTPSPEAGFLTYALAAGLWQLGARTSWLDTATTWCWNQIEAIDKPVGYTVKFALQFLDAVPDPARAAANTSNPSTFPLGPPRRAGPCSTTQRSPPNSIDSNTSNSPTAAGTSTSCTTPPVRPWNGAA